MDQGQNPERAVQERTGPSIIRRVMRVLLRLLVVVVVGMSLGVGLYFAVPAIYRGLVEPVRLNSERLDRLEGQTGQLQRIMEQSLADLQERQAALEVDLLRAREGLDEAQARAARLEETVAELRQDLQSLGPRVERIQGLAAQLDDAKTQLRDLQELIEAGQAPLQDLQHRLTLMQALERLTHAQLALQEDNMGVLRQDLDAADRLLEHAIEGASAEDVRQLEAIRERLVVVLAWLPDEPLLAAEDLEMAWDLLARAAFPADTSAAQ